MDIEVKLNPTTVPVFLVEKYGGLGARWIGIGSGMILEMGWVLGRKVKHEYGS